MIARDIKIGDWVSYDGHKVKVTSVSQQLCKLKGEQLTYSVAPKDIKGIVLTGNILADNGWKEYGLNGCWRHANDELEIYAQGNCVWSLRENYPKHIKLIAMVHELQHLLWALGLDDKMKV